MQKRLNAVHNWRWVLFQLELPKAWAARKDPESAVEGYLEHAAIRQLADVARSVKADIYLANDWHTLPVALTLAQQHDGYVCYDTHEYAIEEYRQYLDWRITRIPIAKAVEKTGLEKALVASTVSQGIADDMVGVYGLNKPILQIRNVPNRAHTEFKPCGSGKIRVLYHGLIVKDRGLEHCVRSVRYWRDEFIFLLRGPISDDFKKELEKIARESGVEDRVKFLPSAPMMDLVRLAREDGDIGLFTPLKLSRHYIYVLPNKLFEYIQAGLAICVADLPDMSRVVREHDLGHVIPVVKPKAIAEAINRFTRADIDRYKRNSIAASHELCWEVESQKMLSAYEAALAALGR
jgi:glycosyltransferase involved in cell wall biosynthesis